MANEVYFLLDTALISLRFQTPRFQPKATGELIFKCTNFRHPTEFHLSPSIHHVGFSKTETKQNNNHKKNLNEFIYILNWQKKRDFPNSKGFKMGVMLFIFTSRMSIWGMVAFESRNSRMPWSENKDWTPCLTCFQVSALQIAEAARNLPSQSKVFQRYWGDSPRLPSRPQTDLCSCNTITCSKLKRHFCKCTLWNKHVSHKMSLISFNGYKIVYLFSLPLSLSSVLPFLSKKRTFCVTNLWFDACHVHKGFGTSRCTSVNWPRLLLKDSTQSKVHHLARMCFPYRLKPAEAFQANSPSFPVRDVVKG